MTREAPPPSRLSVALSGKMVQLNISLLVLVVLILGVLSISSRSSNPMLVYGGVVIALLSCVALITFVILFYSRQKARPLDGETVAISMKNKAGREVSIKNPPDSLFEKGELNALARSILVGYDENLCPDGEILGKASDQNYRLYSEEEKTAFKTRHIEEITGKKFQAAKLLSVNAPAEEQVISTNFTQGRPVSPGLIKT